MEIFFFQLFYPDIIFPCWPSLLYQQSLYPWWRCGRNWAPKIYWTCSRPPHHLLNHV